MKWTILSQISALSILFASVCQLQALEVGGPLEEIYYFDESLPPVIEAYEWDEQKHWCLKFVYFDSDGDWALDTMMHLAAEPSDLSAAEKEARRARDAKFNIVVKDGARFIPYSEETKNTRRVYPKDQLYAALAADLKFRHAPSGSLRLLEPPLPAWPGNLNLRNSPAYQNLLKRLSQVKLASPPRVPPKEDKK